jgi:hypothetical protein
LCFAAYGGALGALGLGPAAHRWVVEPLIFAAVVLSFGLVSALALRRGHVATFLVSAAGAALVLAGRLALDQTSVTAVGALLLVGAALANSAQCGSAARPSLRPGLDGFPPGPDPAGR